MKENPTIRVVSHSSKLIVHNGREIPARLEVCIVAWVEIAIKTKRAWRKESMTRHLHWRDGSYVGVGLPGDKVGLYAYPVAPYSNEKMPLIDLTPVPLGVVIRTKREAA